MTNIDKIKLTDKLNLRKKLTDSQKELIREHYKCGGVSTRELAEKYGVSRRTIQFSIYPERYELSKERRRKAWAEGKYREYYNTKQHTQAMQSIRTRKKMIRAKVSLSRT